MSRFDAEVSKAQNDLQWRRVIFFLLVAVGVLSVGIYALLFRQTQIVVSPEEVVQTHQIEVSGGVAMMVGDHLLSLSSDVELTVSAPGFKTQITTVDSTQLGKSKSIQLVPAPALLKFSVTPKQQAKWLVDGALISESSEIEHEVVAGEHQITVISAIGVKQTLRFEVERGASLEKTFEFEPISGTFKFKVNPDGQLTIDGASVSGRETSISGGKHQVEVSLEGYYPVTDIILLTTDGDVIERSYVLKPKPLKMNLDLAPNDGLLTINGAKVSIAGKKQIEIPYREQLVVQYSKGGHSKVKKTYTPKPGETLNFDAQLQMQLGRIRFVGTDGASVKINGKDAGAMPFEIDLPTGTYVAEAFKEGFQSQTKKVTSRSDRTQIAEFNLASIAALKKASSPNEYISQFGLGFKLIKAEGQTFQMGGDRGEKGQRANEIIRNIKFTKNFYVSTTELTKRQFGKGDDTPLTNTAWIDVAKFCNQASMREKLKPFYQIEGNAVVGYNKSADGYRIITEAEWEYLARRFGKKKQTIFVWGKKATVPVGAGNLADQNSQATLKMYIPGYNDSFPALAPVKSFGAQPEGIFDLIGNASEWVNDSYVLAPMAAGKLEIDPLGGSPRSLTKTVKGSSYVSASLSELRAAFRDGTSEPREELGFRLARYM
jgi:formylglycine-generating enzyme required for sulfatase activity